jgi:AcrR family transcriptional regulator
MRPPPKPSNAPPAAHRRLRPPRQERSRQSQERVLDAFGRMLTERPFEQITMANLARRAGVAVTSIYARFEDKRALVLALHERHVAETLAFTDALLDPERWRGRDLAAIVHGILAGVVARQRPREHLLRAALILGDHDVEARVAHLMRHGSERLATLLRPHLRHLASAERDQQVDFAFRAVMAVLQQRLLFPTTEPGRYRLTDKSLTARLIALFLAAVGDT